MQKINSFIKEFGCIILICSATAVLQNLGDHIYLIALILLLYCFHRRDKNTQYLKKYIKRYKNLTLADVRQKDIKTLTYGALAVLIWISYVYIIYYATGCDHKGCFEKYVYFRYWCPFLLAWALHISYLSLIIKRLISKGIIC